MVDRGKVIADLKLCASGSCKGCRYFMNWDNRDGRCWDALNMDAVKLLEGHGEPTRPVFNGRFWECEKCGEMYQDILEVRKYRHCPWCGRRIEWG